MLDFTKIKKRKKATTHKTNVQSFKEYESYQARN